MGMWHNSLRTIPSIGFVLPRFERLDHADWASTGLTFESDGVLSEGYGHGGPGVCLGDGQTEVCLKNTGMAGPVTEAERVQVTPK